MKKIKLIVCIIFMVLVASITLSFTIITSEHPVVLQYFYVNPDGSRGAPVIGVPDCEGPNPSICIAEYDTFTNLPTGRYETGLRRP